MMMMITMMVMMMMMMISIMIDVDCDHDNQSNHIKTYDRESVFDFDGFIIVVCCGASIRGT